MRYCKLCNEQLPLWAKGVLCQTCTTSKRPAITRQPRRTAPKESKTTFYTARYGLSVEQQRILYGQQYGRCAICNRAMFLVLDHDHATRKARGYLCRGCNTKLAGLDDAEFMRKATEYLQNSPVNKL